MKFSWGTWIAIVYTVFAGSMIFAVIKSFSVDRSLVVDDYYAHDLAYQQHYDKMQNSLSLPERVVIKLTDDQRFMTVDFPADLRDPKGVVLFYNPSRKDLDFTVAIETDETNKVSVPVEKLRAGRWKVKVDWSAEGKSYYDEQEFLL